MQADARTESSRKLFLLAFKEANEIAYGDKGTDIVVAYLNAERLLAAHYKVRKLERVDSELRKCRILRDISLYLKLVNEQLFDFLLHIILLRKRCFIRQRRIKERL